MATWVPTGHYSDLAVTDARHEVPGVDALGRAHVPPSPPARSTRMEELLDATRTIKPIDALPHHNFRLGGVEEELVPIDVNGPLRDDLDLQRLRANRIALHRLPLGGSVAQLAIAIANMDFSAYVHGPMYQVQRPLFETKSKGPEWVESWQRTASFVAC